MEVIFEGQYTRIFTVWFCILFHVQLQYTYVESFHILFINNLQEKRTALQACLISLLNSLAAMLYVVFPAIGVAAENFWITTIFWQICSGKFLFLSLVYILVYYHKENLTTTVIKLRGYRPLFLCSLCG